MIIANELNKFFANIGPNLANKISNVHLDISDHLNRSFKIAFELSIQTKWKYKI